MSRMRLGEFSCPDFITQIIQNNIINTRTEKRYIDSINSLFLTFPIIVNKI